MTENKRFKIVKTDTYDLYVPVDEMKLYIFPSFEEELDCIRFVDVLNDLENLRVENGKIASNLLKENEQLKEEIARQKYTKHIMRENIKSYERAIKRLRKSYEEFDEMRLERIRFLEKRLKKNGLSIYVNDCGDVE